MANTIKIVAKYAGRCAGCGQRFIAGDTVDWSRESRATYHLACARTTGSGVVPPRIAEASVGLWRPRCPGCNEDVKEAGAACPRCAEREASLGSRRAMAAMATLCDVVFNVGCAAALDAVAWVREVATRAGDREAAARGRASLAAVGAAFAHADEITVGGEVVGRTLTLAGIIASDRTFYSMRALRNFYRGLAPVGEAVAWGIAPDDSASRRFMLLELD